MKPKLPILLASAVFAVASVHAQTVLFRDDFTRTDNTDLNASDAGQSGSLSPLNWVEINTVGGTAEIVGNQLRIDGVSDGGSGAIVYPDQNFTGLTSLKVTVDIDSGDSNGDGRATGFGLGFSKTVLDAKTSTSSSTSGLSSGSDFYLGYDTIGASTSVIVRIDNSQVFSKAIPITPYPVEYSVTMTFADMDNGTSISYEVFENGSPIHNGTTSWTGTDENYIAFASNCTLDTDINFIEVAVVLDGIVKENNTNNLNLGSSWVGSTAPASGDLAIWDSKVLGANSTVLGADITWGGIAVQDPGGLVTIGSGNTLTLDGSDFAVDLSTATVDLEINADLALTGSGDIWSVNTGRTVTAGGVISGSSGIDKQGAGTLALGGANTLNGAVTVSGGTLAFTNVAPLDNVSGIAMSGGTTLRPDVVNAAIAAPITVGATGTTVTITGPSTKGGLTGTTPVPFTLDGAISGDGDLTFSGIQTSNGYSNINLNGAGDYAGSTLVTATDSSTNTQIFVRLGIENALPATTVLTLDGGNGPSTSDRYCLVDLQGNNQTLAGLTNIPRNSTRSQRIINSNGTASTLTINNSDDYSFSGILGTTSGLTGSTGVNFGLTKTGAGILTLSGANAYSEATQVDGGILVFANTSAKAPATATASATGSIGLGVGGAGYYSGTDVLDLFNTDTLTGFDLDPASGVAIDTTNGDLTLESTQPLTAAARSLTKLGDGDLWLKGNNTYTGDTIITDGALLLGNFATAGKLDPSSTITIAEGANLNVRRGNLMEQGVDFSSAPITGGGSFSKGGSGTTVFNAANAYTGTTFVNDGVLRLDTVDALPGGIGATGGISTLALGGVLGLAHGNFTRSEGIADDQFYWNSSGGFAAYGADRTVNVGALSWQTTTLVNKNLILSAGDADATLIWASTLSFSNGARTFQIEDGSAAVDARISGKLTGGGGGSDLIKTGAGTMELSSTSNDYDGSTTISAGTLKLGASGVIPNTSDVFIDTATLDTADGVSETAATLDVTGAATINLGTGATLDFAHSSAIDWTGGTLNITGDFQSGVSLKFGTDANGLTSTQLGLITVNGGGGPFTLDGSGFLTEIGGYTAWTAGPFLGTLSNTDASVDFDNGGLTTGIEWVVGGDPTDGSDDAGKAPTFDNTDPDFFIFTYNRTDAANADPNTAIAVEYGSDLDGWDDAVDDATDVFITETDNGAIDSVEVKLRRSAFGDKLFARLRVTVTP